MDAGNLPSPCSVAASFGASARRWEYRQHIEKDPALERRFQQVYVAQPTVEDTISILRGLRSGASSTTA